MSPRTLEALFKLRAVRKLVPVNTEWRHKKGGLYRVVGHGLCTDTGEARINYQRIDGPQFDPLHESEIEYSRLAAEWTPDRFTLTQGPTQH